MTGSTDEQAPAPAPSYDAALTADTADAVPVPHATVAELLAARLEAICALTGCRAAGVHLLNSHLVNPALTLSAYQGLTDSEVRLLASLRGAISTPEEFTQALNGLCAPAGSGQSCQVVALQTNGTPSGWLWTVPDGNEQPLSGAAQVLPLLGAQLAEELALRAALEQAGAERGRYARLASNLKDAIWSYYLQPRPHLALMSAGITQLTGYSREDFFARPQLWQEMVYPDDRPVLQQELARTLAGTSSAFHFRARIVTKSGEIRWAHTRGNVVQDEVGLRLDAITTDVTDHVRLEEKVRRADRLSAVGLLASGIAHEYNNLHFAILGTLDLLLMRTDLEPGVRQHINRVRESAERAADITNKMVAFARGGTGGRENLDLPELIEATLGMIQKEFTTLGIEVLIKQSPLPLKVRGNRAELGQVLINLVINAQQAMQEAPVKRLTLTTGMHEQRICITIADTGHGIPPENLSRLFDPFFTTKGAAGSWLEDRAAADAYLPGRGLGLSVAQTIIQEHGGDIEVESDVGCGTKLSIYLPPADLAEPQSDIPAPLVEVRKGRILVADDEDAVREVCRELLERMDYEVGEAGGGLEALKLLEQEDFDLVLVDLQMPDMEGLELIRRINEIPAERRPAKLIITGNIADLPPETCTDLGIAGLLQKRASLSELISKVQLALSTTRL